MSSNRLSQVGIPLGIVSIIVMMVVPLPSMLLDVLIAANITGVSTAADSTTQALSQTRQAVDELSRMAGELRASVASFTV